MTSSEQIEITVVRLREEARMPRYAHDSDAGADLAICDDVTIEPGERALVGTGIALELPPGYAAFLHPRSGLAARQGLSMVNAPGTIDAGYRGEVKVNLLNTDPREPIRLKQGDFIAQMVIQAVEQVRFAEAESLTASERGGAGHGSTGGVSAWMQEDEGRGSASSPRNELE